MSVVTSDGGQKCRLQENFGKNSGGDFPVEIKILNKNIAVKIIKPQILHPTKFFTF